MRTIDIITKKREKEELSKEEIVFFVEGFANGKIPDYQASAWAMAVLLNGMTPRETTDLTLAIAASGDTLDLSDVVDLAIDKHSSGGVGDIIGGFRDRCSLWIACWQNVWTRTWF